MLSSRDHCLPTMLVLILTGCGGGDVGDADISKNHVSAPDASFLESTTPAVVVKGDAPPVAASNSFCDEGSIRAFLRPAQQAFGEAGGVWIERRGRAQAIAARIAFERHLRGTEANAADRPAQRPFRRILSTKCCASCAGVRLPGRYQLRVQFMAPSKVRRSRLWSTSDGRRSAAINARKRSS